MCAILKLLQEYNADFHQVNLANVTALGELYRIRDRFRHVPSIELLSQLEKILVEVDLAELKMCVIIEGEQVQHLLAPIIAPNPCCITILLADEPGAAYEFCGV
jgi:hypothetical protein